MNHLHCCHKVKAWVCEQYLEKRNRSPYREKSFESMLRTYEPSLKKQVKTDVLNRSRLQVSKTDQQQCLADNQNRITSAYPILEIQEMQETPTKDKIVFRQIQVQHSQSSQQVIFPYGNPMLEFDSSFKQPDILDSEIPSYTVQQGQCVVLQTSSLQEQSKQQRQSIEKQPNLSAQEHLQILQKLLSCTLNPDLVGLPKKFSIRIVKRQFSDLWKKESIEELCEKIIQTRRLCHPSDKQEVKNKLRQVLILQLE